ncbi:DNA alkylation repair protein [Mesorhizobium sp. CAU 1732]|uniref:DNA alkylation repair protein n=1 Tax=Mesorhizobium sp. CAU 1732 TaxID=3140358 RepID=UPI00326122FD
MAASSTDASPALKEIFDRARLQHFADETAAIWPRFDRERFLSLATDGLDDLGIMQRMRRTAEAFAQTLPADYAEALAVLRDLAPRIRHGFASITLCEFVAIRGRDAFERSMEALHFFTRFGSAEFAIRHFLRDDFERTLAVMKGWARDENEHVRRLASEGSRPRLPWSFQLKNLIADPSPTVSILDALKADDSLYVRKSVANHLNDIAKDNPDYLLDRLSGWDRDDARTEWIVRHALRTLIKKGEPRALALIGTTGEADVAVDHFTVAPAVIRLGERITLSARIVSTANERQKLVADYAIHYVKKSGATSRKVFKLKTFDLAAGGTMELAISQQIRDFTTRTHNAGLHKVEFMLNGQVLADGGFELKANAQP